MQTKPFTIISRSLSLVVDPQMVVINKLPKAAIASATAIQKPSRALPLRQCSICGGNTRGYVILSIPQQRPESDPETIFQGTSMLFSHKFMYSTFSFGNP
jgi:hypothetical protein